jgi:hypothetical protein
MLGYALNGSLPGDVVVAVGVILLAGYVLQFAFAVGSKLPLINQNSILDFGSMKSRRSYVTGAADLIKSGFAKVSPFIHPSELIHRTDI